MVHSSHAGPELEPLTPPAVTDEDEDDDDEDDEDEAESGRTHGETSDMVAADDDETGCALTEAEERERSAGDDCIEIWARSARGRQRGAGSGAEMKEGGG